MMARKLFVCFCFDRCKAQEGVWRAECAAAAVRPRRRRLHRVVHQQGLRHRQVLRRRHRLHLPQAVPGSGCSAHAGNATKMGWFSLKIFLIRLSVTLVVYMHILSFLLTPRKFIFTVLFSDNILLTIASIITNKNDSHNWLMSYVLPFVCTTSV